MDVPLTPIVVDCVTFDRAPLGRRGYHEDQVDDFLDRVQATLEGKDHLTAQAVRDVVFDPAPFIRRGYNEDQVDEFLDLVLEELTRREGGPSPAAADAQARPGTPPHGTAQPGQLATGVTPPGSGPQPAPAPAFGPAAASAPFPGPYTSPVNAATRFPRVPPPTPAEQTNPMLFAIPPSLPHPTTQPVTREPGAASGPAKSSVAATTDTTGAQAGERPADPGPVDTGPSAQAGQVASELRASSTDTPDETEVPRHPSADVERQSPAQTEAEPPTVSAQPPSPAVASTAARTVQPHAPAAPSTAQPPPPVAAPAHASQPEAQLPEPAPAEPLALPLPVAPPGEYGYEPHDVARLMQLLAATPDRDQLAALTLSRTAVTGQGYHAGAVDALRQAWLAALGGPTTRP